MQDKKISKSLSDFHIEDKFPWIFASKRNTVSFCYLYDSNYFLFKMFILAESHMLKVF